MKRILYTTISLWLSIALLIPTVADASSGHSPITSAEAAFLYEPYTKTVLYSKNADKTLPMASTTKIMTALVVVEKTVDLSEVITVPNEAIGIEGSSIYLKENDQISILDLLYSLLLQSANDAATALAVHVGGDTDSFAQMMNERAKALGAYDTHFTNPHGLDDKEHYTTARDLAIITAAAMENTLLSKIFSTYKHSFFISDSPRVVVNHNKLLKSYEYAVGVKTGYTKKCGRCLVSAAEKDGVTLIAVTLNAPDDWRDHKAMLDFGLDSLKAYMQRDISNTVFEIPVIGGVRECVSATADTENLKIILPEGAEAPRAEINLRQYIIAPIEAGDCVGEIVYYSGDTEIKRVKIYTDEAVSKYKKGNLFDFFFGE